MSLVSSAPPGEKRHRKRHRTETAEPSRSSPSDTSRRIELGVTTKHEVVELLNTQDWMSPAQRRRATFVPSRTLHQTRLFELRRLIGAGNRGEDIKRGQVRIELEEHGEMLEERRFILLRKTENVREVSEDLVFSAHLDDPRILVGMIVMLVHRTEHPPIHRLDTDEHL